MTSDSEGVEGRVQILFGPVVIEEIPLETKAEDEDLCTSQMVIDVNTIKNELAENKSMLHLKIKHWTRQMQNLQVKNAL